MSDDERVEEIDGPNGSKVRKRKAEEGTKKKVVDDDSEYDEDASVSVESEEEYSTSDESEDEEEDQLFDFILTQTGQRKILVRGDITATFAIDVCVAAAKLGAEIRKKTESLRVVGKRFALKMTPQNGDEDVLSQAFEEIGNPSEVSAEANLLAYLLASE